MQASLCEKIGALDASTRCAACNSSTRGWTFTQQAIVIRQSTIKVTNWSKGSDIAYQLCAGLNEPPVTNTVYTVDF